MKSWPFRRPGLIRRAEPTSDLTATLASLTREAESLQEQLLARDRDLLALRSEVDVWKATAARQSGVIAGLRAEIDRLNAELRWIGLGRAKNGKLFRVRDKKAEL